MSKKIRNAKLITNNNDLEFLLNIKEEDIDTNFIMDNLGEFNGKIRFNPYDIIEVPPNTYGSNSKKNKNKFRTTVGLWIFNKYFIEKDLFEIFEYINETIDSKLFKKMNKKLSYAVLEDDITIEQLKKYLLKTQKFMPYVSILSPSYTEAILTCNEYISKKKQMLLKQYEKEIKSGDANTVEKIEKELLDYAKDILKDDPSLDTYESGARGSFGNNFKNLFVMKGAIRNPDPNAKQEYDIATSNYMDGMSKEEYHIFCNSLSAGPFSRASKTSIGGYWEKLFVSAYQHVVTGDKGSDCKTKRYITVDFSKQNPDDYIYSYIIEGDKLVELNSKNIDKYRGKTVKMRFSSMCEAKGYICNKCVGNLPYKLNIKNIGMVIPTVASTLKNFSMKNFHDSTVTLVEMNPMEVIRD